MRRLRAVLAAGVVAVAGLVAAAPARANGDPASHVLLVSNVFYPGKPVKQATKRALDSVTAQAKRKGYPIKVALIEDRIDLGLLPSLLGKPQEYADILLSEISFGKTYPLLAVMKNGFGTTHTGPGTRKALAGLKIPEDADSDELARVAIVAVDRLARERGIRLTVPKLASGGPNADSGGPSVLVFALPVLAALLWALIAGLRRRGAAEGAGP